MVQLQWYNYNGKDGISNMHRWSKPMHPICNKQAPKCAHSITSAIAKYWKELPLTINIEATMKRYKLEERKMPPKSSHHLSPKPWLEYRSGMMLPKSAHHSPRNIAAKNRECSDRRSGPNSRHFVARDEQAAQDESRPTMSGAQWLPPRHQSDALRQGENKQTYRFTLRSCRTKV
jgi:hypothetical protein